MLKNTLTPAHVRAARGLLQWSQQQPADASGVGLSTVRDFEACRRDPVKNNLAALQAALEAAGVTFIEDRIGAPGVVLQAPAGISPDPKNFGWFSGWGVVRPSPWHFVGLFSQQEEAQAERDRRGDAYEVRHGSHRLGSSDFMY